MIPKIIHYCWFGRKEKPRDVLEYIETWKKHLPDFQIKEWNEDNFNINQFEYTKEAYYAKKYAFVSDVARLYALINEGGIYLDTDVKFLKPLPQSILESKGFVGFENNKNIGTAVMATEPHHPIFVEFFNIYKNINFFNGLKFDLCPNVNRLTKILENKGLQRDNSYQCIDDINIFPQVCFSAKMYRSGEYYNTDETYAIHDFKATWAKKEKSYLYKLITFTNTLKTIILYKLNQL